MLTYLEVVSCPVRVALSITIEGYSWVFEVSSKGDNVGWNDLEVTFPSVEEKKETFMAKFHLLIPLRFSRPLVFMV